MAERQASHKRPRLFHDYRDMLKERDLDIVEVATPDHWHALPAIAAIEAGVDVYCQKPVSVDVVEGQAMLAAARKHNRVVQIGTQRRSTPHLVEARDQFVRSGRLGKVAHVEIYSYYHNGAHLDADTTPPPNLDYEFWTGPAPMRPYNPLVHPRSWRQFMEYGNGTIGDMGVHMLDMARWMLGLGWPKRISSSAESSSIRTSRSNITDTQIATFEFDDLDIVWQHRHWGAPPDPKYLWGATLYGDQGTLKAGVYSYDFQPAKGEPVHKDVTYELDKYPEDNTEPQIEKHVAPAIRYHMKDFLAAIDARSKPVADIEEGDDLLLLLHPGQHGDESSAALSNGTRQGRRIVKRRRSQSPAAPALPRALGAPGTESRVVMRFEARVIGCPRGTGNRRRHRQVNRDPIPLRCKKVVSLGNRWISWPAADVTSRYSGKASNGVSASLPTTLRLFADWRVA